MPDRGAGHGSGAGAATELERHVQLLRSMGDMPLRATQAPLDNPSDEGLHARSDGGRDGLSAPPVPVPPQLVPPVPVPPQLVLRPAAPPAPATVPVTAPTQPGPRRPRRPRRARVHPLAVVTAVVATAAILAVAASWDRPQAVHAGGSAAPARIAPAEPAGGAAAGAAPAGAAGATRQARAKLGVFRGTDDGQVARFQRWLGRDVVYVVDFPARRTWGQVADPRTTIEHYAGTRYHLVLSTPLLAEDGHSTIEAGSRGAYDRYYRALGRNLVRGGQPDAVIRLGWEFNLGSSHWQSDDPVAFIAYWRRVVRAMRSVPGQRFRFDWNVNVAETAYDGAAYYPGNAYVDYVGVDVYDVSWEPQTYPYPRSCDAGCRLTRQRKVWQRLYAGQHGLVFWADFARSKGRPMSLPEWGLWGRSDGHGGRDDPYFIRRMHAFIADPANHVAYQAYFEANLPKAQHSLATFPKAGATFRTLFGAR